MFFMYHFGKIAILVNHWDPGNFYGVLRNGAEVFSVKLQGRASWGNSLKKWVRLG